MKISLITLGCAKNIADSENILGLLKAKNYDVEAESSKADVFIINTCTFIKSATNENLDLIIDLANKKAKIIIIGCLAERYKLELFKEFPEVRIIIGTGDLNNIINALEWLKENFDNSLQKSFLTKEKGYIAASDTPKILLNKTVSAFVKIAEGCNHRCTFCIIPSLRGQFRSRNQEDIIKEIKSLVALGIKEVNLVSQDSSSYGIDLYKKRALGDLLNRIAGETSVEWLRIMYCYPFELDKEALQAIYKHKSILKYIDMPLQHSHPNILRQMARPKNSREAIKIIRDSLGDFCLRTTFITGFPNEIEEEFEDLVNFIKEEKFDRLGVFTYSHEDFPRDIELKDNISQKIKEKRKKTLMELQMEISLKKNQALIGKEELVLIESEFNGNFLARTFRDAPEIDCTVHVKSKEQNKDLIGKFIKVKIYDAKAYDLYADIAESGI